MTARNRLIIGTLLAGALVAAPAAAQKIGEVDRVEPTPSAPRGKVLEATSPQGQPYWYRLPKKITKGEPPNLVFMLHGTGMRWGWAFWNYPIASGGFRRDDIVVAPEGMTPGHGDTFNFVQGRKDGEQIASLIKHFRRTFPIGKVYVYGHSQGAFFAYWLAGAHTELVDGIVAHAGNVLDVDHNELAKKKVAIGILHGRADAVVPVECAYRTQKIYAEQGYEKLKLEIVEGLTETSGHWPLPKQVAEMLAWLDQVSVDDPGQALASAWLELTKPAPDVTVLADLARRAARFLKRYSGEDKERIEGRLALLRGLLDRAEAEHLAAIETSLAGRKPADFGSWMGHFRSVHAAFRDSPGWRSRLKAVIAKKKKHDKLVAKTADRLGARASARTVAAAMKAIERAPLADGYDMLATMLARHLESRPKGVKAKAVEAHRALASERTPLLEQGRKAAADVTKRLAEAFRGEHPELFRQANDAE